MLRLGITCFLLVVLWRKLEAKGIAKFGKVGHRSSTTDNGASSEDPAFRFALLTPTARVATPSESFSKFVKHAIEARLYGYSDYRMYYFVPGGVAYEKAWLSDSNVCKSNVKAWRVSPKNYVLNETESWITIHFLCDQYCCGADCCDLNVLFLVCLIFIIVVILFFIMWICCRYGRQRCARIKHLQELTLANAMESSQQQLNETLLIDGDSKYFNPAMESSPQ